MSVFGKLIESSKREIVSFDVEPIIKEGVPHWLVTFFYEDGSSERLPQASARQAFSLVLKRIGNNKVVQSLMKKYKKEISKGH